MFSLAHNHEGKKVMKSNLFGKLSAGVAGVALMAIGLGSTPVQAATVTVRFQDTEHINGQYVPNNNPFDFKGQFTFEAFNHNSISISSWGLASVNKSTNQESWITTSKPTITFNNNALSLIYVIPPSQTGNNVEERRFTLEDLYRTSTPGYIWNYGDGSSQILTNGNWQPWANLSYNTVVHIPANTPIPPIDPKGYYDNEQGRYYSLAPEPSTYFGTILAFGALGAVKTLKRKQKNKETFTP